MNDSPRILFVAPSAYLLGGVQVWLDYLLPGLSQLGWEPVLGLVAGKHHHKVEPYVSVHPGHTFVPIPNVTGTREGRIQALVESIRTLKPDILVSVNIHDCYPAIHRLRNIGQASPKLVVVDHSIEADYLFDARDWAHVIDGFIGTNRLTLRLATCYSGLDPDRVYYAPYGVRFESFDIKNRFPANRPIRIAYSGRVEDFQKRSFDIPEILHKLRLLGVEYRFRLAGGGPGLVKLREDLSKEVETGCVEFLGVLDADSLNERLYDWADALLLTSYWETGPIVIWEAMARGLPIVSTHYIGSGLESALVDRHNCLLFPIGDTSAAASQLSLLSKDEQLGSMIAENAVKLIQNRYSRTISVNGWNECLQKILTGESIPLTGTVPDIQAAGRLDRVLGISNAEKVRKALGLSYDHADAGGEWPHTGTSLNSAEQSEFWAMSSRLDA